MLSEFVLEVPATKLDVPWVDLSSSPLAGAAGSSLKDVLAAVYANAPGRIRNAIDGELLKRFGGIEKFVEAFRKSLEDAGQLTVVAKLPDEGAKSVRFLVKGEKEQGYRVFGFRLVNGRYVYEDIVPDSGTALELAVFSRGAKADAEPAGTETIAVRLIPAEFSCSPKFVANVRRIQDPLAPKSTGVAAIDFLATCRRSLQENRIEAFLSCYSPDRAKQFREVVDSFSAAQRAEFIRRQFDVKGETILLRGGDVNVLFFHGSTRRIGHVNIVRTNSSNFELIDGLTSGVLDSVLNGPEFVDEISRLIR